MSFHLKYVYAIYAFKRIQMVEIVGLFSADAWVVASVRQTSRTVQAWLLNS